MLGPGWRRRLAHGLGRADPSALAEPESGRAAAQNAKDARLRRFLDALAAGTPRR
jgi:hypothetical protein